MTSWHYAINMSFLNFQTLNPFSNKAVAECLMALQSLVTSDNNGNLKTYVLKIELSIKIYIKIVRGLLEAISIVVYRKTNWKIMHQLVCLNVWNHVSSYGPLGGYYFLFFELILYEKIEKRAHEFLGFPHFLQNLFERWHTRSPCE